MNEDGTVNRKSVKRKGMEIMHSLEAEGGENMEKLFQAAADSGSVNASTMLDAIKAVQSIEVSWNSQNSYAFFTFNPRLFFLVLLIIC